MPTKQETAKRESDSIEVEEEGMTREEFIDGYLARSAPKGVVRIKEGFWIGTHRKIALPCACGDEICEGWAMVSDQGIHDHLTLYAPEPLRSLYCNPNPSPSVSSQGE
jgi:hypothetical protein